MVRSMPAPGHDFRNQWMNLSSFGEGELDSKHYRSMNRRERGQIKGVEIISLMARHRLRELIFKGAFFDISEDALLVQIQDEFTCEFERLKNVKVAHRSLPIVTSIQSPSQLLYGKDYAEINGTLVGVLALRWIKVGDYERLVGNEEESLKPQPESLQWIQQVFENGIKSHDDLYALVMSLLIDNLGKDPDLARDYERKTGKNGQRPE
jgi:hypothetical protein